MKAYPMYTAIPLPWLPQLPVHWELLRNKNIFQETKEIVGDKADLYPLLSLTTKGIILRDTASSKGKFPKDFNTYKIVRQGDMAFCLFDIDETPRTVGLSDYDGMLTGAYTIFHVKNVNSGYVYYYYLSLDNVKVLRSLYSGLRKTINTGTFLGTKLPVPPREEQDQIVRFLDWKVSGINKLINIRTRQIAELEKYKETAISYYVTHGLKKTEMCPTEIYWLHEVPIDWNETKLKFLLKKHKREVPEAAELLICSNSGDVKKRGDSKLGLVASSKDIYQGVLKGDLLIHGMDTWHGAIAISDYDGMCTPVVHVCTCNQSKRFVAYYLKMMAYTKVYKAISNGVRQNTSDFRSWDNVANLLIAFPDFKEQERIADHIDKIVHAIDNIGANYRKQIEQLHKFKTRLISDVVTGKIDVRDVKIPEFNMVEEDIEDEVLEDNDEIDASGEVE